MFTQDILKYSYEIVVRLIFRNFWTFYFFLLFCISPWIIFDFKIKFSGKNWVEKHIRTIVFLFGSKINEFGRVWTEKIRIWRKKFFYKKAAVNPLVWHNHHEMHTGQLYWPKVAWKSLFIVPENAFLRFELGFLSKVWVFYGFYIKFCMWLNDFWAKTIETDHPSQVDWGMFKRRQFALKLA